MSNSLPNIAIGYSDVSMLSPTASKFNISDIPTLRLYIYYPNFIDYSGDLSARSISSWLKKIVNEPALNIENLSTLEDIREQNNPIVVFIGKIGTSSYTKFQEVTRSMHRDHEISFCYVNIETASISLLNELNLNKIKVNNVFFDKMNCNINLSYLDSALKNIITNKNYVVRILDNSDNFAEYYEYELNERNLERFITNKLMYQFNNKEIRKLTPDDLQKAKTLGKAIMILFEGKNINQDHSPILEQFVELRKMPIYRAGFESPFHLSLINDFEIQRTASQQLWVLDYREGGFKPKRVKYAPIKYPQAQITKQGVVEFINSIERELHPRLFTHNTKCNYVHTFTELTFQHEIKRVTTETVVLFIKDHCKECNKMEQQFYETAKSMSQYKTLVFGQLNLSRLEVLEEKGDKQCETVDCYKTLEDLSNTPYIKFYPADHRDGLVFEGSIENLSEFILNNRKIYDTYAK